MPGIEHTYITDLACQLLPDWQQQRLSPERQRLQETWCKLPDMWFGFGAQHDLADRYYFETDGIQFHYLPDTPIVPLYRYYRRDPESERLKLLKPYANPHWTHASRGFTHYFEQAIDAWRDERLEDACAYAGWLLHMLQDYSYGSHAIEGPYGTDFFLFQRLFPETDDPAENPLAIIGASAPPPEVDQLVAYEPRLLGIEPAEMALHLYARHVTVTSQARRLCHQIVVHARGGQAELNNGLFHQMYENAAFLCADVLYTIVACGDNRFDHPQPHLQHPMLSDFEPVQRPWLVAPPYRNYAIVRDAAMNEQRRRCPLALRLEQDADVTTFAKGLGIGTHHQVVLSWDLPDNLYTRLSGYLGLHADVAAQGQTEVTLLQDEQQIAHWSLSAERPTVELDVADPAGQLALVMETADGITGAHNHLVLAEPCLQRREWP